MNEQPKQKNIFLDTFDAIAVAFVVAMIIRTFIMSAYKIPTGSMLDTLLIGDHILVNKAAYLFSEPKDGDIVVFEFPLEPDKDYIKRIVGVPGDKIEIKDKVVYRNGEKLEEPFAKFSADSVSPSLEAVRDNVAEFIVPANSYFMMGDNRDSSFDGRFWGLVDRKAIIGKAFIIYWSWGDKSAFGVRFDRIFKLI